MDCWIQNGAEAGNEDIARFIPLLHGRINMLGYYTFTLPEDILKGRVESIKFQYKQLIIFLSYAFVPLALKPP